MTKHLQLGEYQHLGTGFGYECAGQGWLMCTFWG